jgi:hypothetical protein
MVNLVNAQHEEYYQKQEKLESGLFIKSVEFLLKLIFYLKKR